MKIHILIAIGFGLIITSCNTTTKLTKLNNADSAEWVGTYSGVTPCADCPGIETSLTLNDNQTFILKTKYIDRNESFSTEHGDFKWNKKGNITLTRQEKHAPKYFALGNNQISQLDTKGEFIIGSNSEKYILRKIQNGDIDSISEKTWTLIELNNQPRAFEEKQDQPWISILRGDSKIDGSSGCNHFFGQFETALTNQIQFSGIGATKKACFNMNIEYEFFQMLENVKKYQLTPNGELVFLDNENRMLAIFKLQ